MNWVNFDDVKNQLAELIIDPNKGLLVDTHKPERCFTTQDNREKRGWYWLSTKEIGGESYITGAWGIYSGNDNGKVAIKINRDGKAVTISAEDRAAIAARQKANTLRMKAMREAEADRAARAAGNAWRKYLADGTSDYLDRKGVGNHGLRFSPSGNGTLAVPMMDAAGKVWGLQLIRGKKRERDTREKDFWPAGLALTGHYFQFGGIPKNLILIAEGYATAATLHQATGLPVVVAFAANNLQPVAEAIRKNYRRAKILICADDDYLTAGNPGVSAAKNAAFAVDGSVAVPIFAADRAGKKFTDYNDLAQLEGEAQVRTQIEATILALKWSADSAPMARELDREGGGAGDHTMPSIIQIDEAIERFSMIYGAGGTWFDDYEHMLVPKSDLQDILPEHGMRDLRNRKRVVRLDEVGFDPANTDPRIKCNLWGGWPTTPKQGSCSTLLELLEYLCATEENARNIFDWVLKWLAYPIQHPGAKMRTALVFHGPQGAGKNLFFETVMGIYGEYGRIVDQSAVEDKFNDWASRKLFLIADEVVARAELYHVKNKLKGIVTGEHIRINPKNVAAHDEKNHVNLVFLSNERQPLVLEKDDRRYTVIWTPEKLDRAFYNDVKAELEAGGQAALHHYLLNLDLGEFNEFTDPPMTRAKRDVIDYSLDSTQRFHEDWQKGEIVIGDKTLPFCPCASGDLFSAYLKWCKKEGVARPRESNQFVGYFAKLSHWEKATKDRRESLVSATKKSTRFIIPAPDALESAAAGQAEDFRKKPAQSATDWLTECFFAFRQALGDQL